MMAGEDDDKINEAPPPSENGAETPPETAPDANEARTVFAPSPFTQPPSPMPQAGGSPAPSPFDDAPAEPAREKTVPPKKAAAPRPPAEPAAPAPTPQPAASQPGTAFTPLNPRDGGGGIQIGDVLNHMFEVKRFIARGGMGEVFEGVNVASDERVAIKVMLPSLAADPNVQAMFRKEAKTLTKLAHPALVQYRVMATEPQLGVLYIVTEYIDSKNLEDALPGIKTTPAELLALTRRLADGLRVAHVLGAIHRDISPDNVLLEDGQLLKARIIDFGIAKDLDPTSKTIVGEGFAGKLNFVAPEQLGDFDRAVGPWTDIYSLALVILAVANGKPVNMGGTLVDAVDKRRQGPDISGAPAELQPLLSAMLKPNPQERLRSMDEVIAFIDKGGQAAPVASTTTSQPRSGTSGPAKGQPGKPGGGGSSGGMDPKMLMIGGGAAGGLLLLVIIGILVFGGKHPKTDAGQGQASSSAPAAAAATTGSPTDTARIVLAGTLPSISCSWLDLDDIREENGGVDVNLRGVSTDTIAVQKAVNDAMNARGVTLNALHTDNVAPMGVSSACDLINAYSTLLRGAGAPTLTSTQLRPEMDVRDDVEASLKGQKVARVVVNFTIDPSADGIAFYGLDPNGDTGSLFQLTRAQLNDPAYTKSKGLNLQPQPDGSYQLQFNQNVAGWSGLMLVSGRPPFADDLFIPPPAKRTSAWLQSFRTTAGQKNWRATMLWINSVDETPN